MEKIFAEQNDRNKLEEKREKAISFPKVEIPEKLKNGFPEGYKPWLSGWSFTDKELEEKTEITNPDGTKEEIFKMLTLDVSISKAAWAEEMNAIEDPEERNKKIKESYPCPNKCASCYERNADSDNKIVTWEQNVKIIDKACELGLKTVKFLGPGEVINDPDLFKYLDYFEKKGLNFLIFTKPAILMDDKETQKVFNMSSDEFCKKIANYKCVRLLMNFMSADPETEISMVSPEEESFRESFVKNRNKAVEVFTKLGINDDPFNQRLALICAPVLKNKMVNVRDENGLPIVDDNKKPLKKFQKGNIDEAFNIFKWGTERNIPVVIAPTMVSGGCAKSQEEVRDENFKEVDLVGLWADIYDWLDEKGIKHLEELEQEGVAPYAGFSCDQFISGMFIRKDGRIQACPGNEDEPFRYDKNIAKNIDNLPLIWKNNMGYKWREKIVKGIKNGLRKREVGCPAKQSGIAIDEKTGKPLIKEGLGSFPEDFNRKVLRMAYNLRDRRLINESI